MKRLHKFVNWLLLVTMLITNSPIMYAEEIGQAIEQAQLDAAYQEAVEEANEQTVGSENANTDNSEFEQTNSIPEQESGDSIQEPVLPTVEPDQEEQQLKAQYGEPIVEDGQVQVYQADETHFVTRLTREAKTYQTQDGQEVPIDLNLVTHHEHGISKK